VSDQERVVVRLAAPDNGPLSDADADWVAALRRHAEDEANGEAATPPGVVTIIRTNRADDRLWRSLAFARFGRPPRLPPTTFRVPAHSRALPERAPVGSHGRKAPSRLLKARAFARRLSVAREAKPSTSVDDLLAQMASAGEKIPSRATAFAWLALVVAMGAE
jgi:hypothetical protein